MADTFLKIIPTDPSYVPSENSQGDARTLLHHFFSLSEVKFQTTTEIEFIDQGSDFESVFCNLCGQEIDIEDWQSAMDACFESSARNLIFRTACCSSETSLHDLNYKWPAGFSRFCISIQNPQADIHEATLNELQRILESPLRLIWAHY